jgi:hypothetical protein
MPDEYRFSRNGRELRCNAISTGVSSSGPARPSNAQWMVTVDGTEYGTVEAQPDDLESPQRKADLEARILAALARQNVQV